MVPISSRLRARDKIKGLEELAAALRPLRAGGKKVVQCHGVFDLLHIGHIRYFEAARRLGDVLIVTVTADAYVNKGPHRPAFNEALRAEALAALACVDFVAVSRHPTAVEAIGVIRPDVYVKGPDYRGVTKDATGGLERERAAVRAAGGKIAFTDDIAFSSSHILNRRLPVLSDEASRYLRGFARRHEAREVLRVLEGAASLKALVLGEAIIDEYQYCQAIGKSSKEPTLVVKRADCETFAGGSLAVGNNVANFCGRVRLVSFVGDADSREGFIRRRLQGNIDALFLRRKDSPTIVKRRYVESYHFTKLLEVYDINDGPMRPAEHRRLGAVLARELPRHDLVIAVDYGHGMFSEETIALLCRKARFLAVNAQSNAGNLGYHTISRYPRADFVSLTENEIRLELRERQGDLRRLVRSFAKERGFRRLIVTRGSNGCLCYDRKEGILEIPAFAGQVLDRMGAGDAFLSLASLCVAQSSPIEIAGFVGNVAGAQAVATIGHRSSIERAGLFQHIQSLLK